MKTVIGLIIYLIVGVLWSILIIKHRFKAGSYTSFEEFLEDYYSPEEEERKEYIDPLVVFLLLVALRLIYYPIQMFMYAVSLPYIIASSEKSRAKLIKVFGKIINKENKEKEETRKCG